MICNVSLQCLGAVCGIPSSIPVHIEYKSFFYSLLNLYNLSHAFHSINFIHSINEYNCKKEYLSLS